MKNWECPECGEINNGGMILCVCGYRDDEVGQKEEPSVPSSLVTDQVAVDMPMEREARREFKSIGPSSGRLGFNENWLRLASWKDGYVRWVVVALLCISLYRKTTDGLWFIAFLALSVAYRLEAHKKYGTPIIAGKKKGQSIREFGLWRTVVAIICPSCETTDHGDGGRLKRGFLITAIVLHVYVGLIALFDCIDAVLTSQVLSLLNYPFVQILTKWPSFNRTVVDLISHDYIDRLPIINHVYIATVIGCFFYGIYWFSLFFKINLIEYFFDSRVKSIKIEKSLSSCSFFKNIWWKFVKSSFGTWILALVGSVVMSIFIFYIVNIPLYFPGDLHPRHGKYIWMYSYIYKDNIGLFTPIYFISMPMLMIYGCIPYLFEPFFRLYSFIHKLIRK